MDSGTERILIWSQMHGDEPTATCALIDLLQYFGTHRREPWISAVLEKYTLLIVPMLNPDGAGRMQRRNAQGIDINRDARALQTPEVPACRSSGPPAGNHTDLRQLSECVSLY